MTNFERIKNMTFDEMVKLFEDCRKSCDFCAMCHCEDTICRWGITKWLESEAEE